MYICFPAPCIRNCFKLWRKEIQKVNAHQRDTHTHFPNKPPQRSFYLNVNRKKLFQHIFQCFTRHLRAVYTCAITHRHTYEVYNKSGVKSAQVTVQCLFLPAQRYYSRSSPNPARGKIKAPTHPLGYGRFLRIHVCLVRVCARETTTEEQTAMTIEGEKLTPLCTTQVCEQYTKRVRVKLTLLCTAEVYTE